MRFCSARLLRLVGSKRVFIGRLPKMFGDAGGCVFERAGDAAFPAD